MRKIVMTVLACTLGTVAQAAPPTALVATRVQAVSVASREIVADGITWALSSTVTINAPGKARGSLRDVMPGMNVQMQVAGTDGPTPLVQSIAVIPD